MPAAFGVRDGSCRLGTGLRTGTTVVGALGTRETTLWPSKRSVIGIEESVLLLETEPRDLSLCLFHDLCSMMAVVCPVGSAVVVVAFCEDEDVVTSAEGILEDGGGAEVNVRVVTWRLVGRRAIKVPDAEVSDIRYSFRHGLWKIMRLELF